MEKVIVFGSLSMDMSVKCRAIPHRGETAVGSDFLTTPGGMGGNQAVMCSRMGADTFMVGKVGDDAYGRELMASLARHGVICSNVSLSADEHTGIGLVMRGEGDNRAVYDPGANATITYKEVRAAIHGLAGKDNVFLCQLGCDLEATMQSILCAKRNGLFTILNATPARSIPEEVYQALDVLCINEGWMTTPARRRCASSSVAAWATPSSRSAAVAPSRWWTARWSRCRASPSRLWTPRARVTPT